MSIVDREKAELRPGIGQPKTRPASPMIVQFFNLLVDPRFDFAVALLFGAITAWLSFGDRGSYGPRDYSIVSPSAFAALVFAMIGATSMVARQGSHDESVGG